MIKMDIREEFRRLKDTCYLDHAGATLYSEEQIRQVANDLCNTVHGNPHSGSVIGKSTLDAIDQVRFQVLQHFNTDPENYSIIFSSGATAGLKLVAETFDFSNDKSASERGTFAYAQECHTSVLGMREVIALRGSNVVPLPQTKLQQLFQNKQSYPDTPTKSEASSNSLFAYPGQCNFSGVKNPLEWIDQCQKGACNQLGPKNSRWYCILDAAALVSTSPLDLSVYKPDFVVLSFYKIMGYPTGLGALLVRNSSAHTLSKKTYFGGGTVLMALSGQREHTLRPVLHDRFEDGTVAFLSILAVRHGLQTINRLIGNMSAVQKHTFALAKRTYSQLKSFRHSNGAPLVKLYCDTNFSDANNQGAIINFNLLRQSGQYVGYSEVLHMADLFRIHLRVGCFCNLGACQRHLNLTDDEVRAHYQAGHVCGDGNDLIDGQPTGSVRISFGYMSNDSDVDTFLTMIKSCFLRVNLIHSDIDAGTSDELEVEQLRTENEEQRLADNITDTIKLTQIVVFPVKSCGGFRPKQRWAIGPKGLNFDRVWMIVGPSGSVLTQKNEPKLALLKPRISLEEKRLWLSYPGNCDIAVPLYETHQTFWTNHFQSKVCEDRVRGNDCGQFVSNWLSAAIGRPGLRLIRQLDDDSRVGQGDQSTIALANMAQFLLVNEASVEWLWDQLPRNEDCEQEGLLDRFRANLIVRGTEPFEEISWSRVKIGEEIFEVTGPCTRCSIICVDQASGRRTKEPLRTLSEKLHGRVTFGVYLRHIPKISEHRTICLYDAVTF